MRNLIISFVILISGNLCAQQYFPFPTDSARWHTSFSAYSWSCQVPANQYELYISGDTIIGPTVYHKINILGWSGNTSCINYTPGYVGCIREDSNKHVFFRPAWLGVDTLLYDFNVQVGDTLKTFNNGCQETVVLIDSVLIGSSYRKQYHTSGDFWCGNIPRVIIEGVGCSSGLIEEFGMYEARHDLDCMSHREVSLYGGACLPFTVGMIPVQESHEWKASPNPASGSVLLSSPGWQSSASYSVVLWNLAGEKVSSLNCFSQNGSISIERNGLAEGTYIAEIISGQQTISRAKIIFL
jgi:hypothetical protein